MPDLFLFPGETPTSNVKLRDPTVPLASGTGDSTLAAGTSAAIGAERFIGTGARTLTSATAAAAGVERFIATGADTLTRATTTSVGVERFTGTGASTLQPATSADSSIESFIAHGSGTLQSAISFARGRTHQRASRRTYGHWPSHVPSLVDDEGADKQEEQELVSCLSMHL